jgi:hypothetical protein
MQIDTPTDLHQMAHEPRMLPQLEAQIRTYQVETRFLIQQSQA